MSPRCKNTLPLIAELSLDRGERGDILESRWLHRLHLWLAKFQLWRELKICVL